MELAMIFLVAVGGLIIFLMLYILSRITRLDSDHMQAREDLQSHIRE